MLIISIFLCLIYLLLHKCLCRQTWIHRREISYLQRERREGGERETERKKEKEREREREREKERERERKRKRDLKGERADIKNQVYLRKREKKRKEKKARKKNPQQTAG
jgi:hypothetical protein